MPQAVSLLPFLFALTEYGFAGLSIWPSFHVALSNSSVFVDFSTKSTDGIISHMSLSLVDMGTNTTLLTSVLPTDQLTGRVEFNCSCFLYAGTFRFLLRQSSIATVLQVNKTKEVRVESLIWWWSSEIQVQWPTFHIGVERGSDPESFQVGISMSEHFQACTSHIDSDLILDVHFMEHSHSGTDKARTRVRRRIRPRRTQAVQFPCGHPFSEQDYIGVTLLSPRTAREVKSSGPLYLSRLFSYKLLVENANVFKSGCEGMMTVRMTTPPCTNTSGKVSVYSDASAKRNRDFSPAVSMGSEETSSSPLAFNWLARGESETEFNCSVFHAGRNKYCFRFDFNFSRSPSPAQTCLVVYKSAESWGPWQPWTMCSASCGEAVRERVRECLLPSGVPGLQCTGMMKEQSMCSLEGCIVSPSPSPSLPPARVGVTSLGGNLIAVVGISLCLSVIMATVVVTVWRKFCQSPQCGSVHRGSAHTPGGRKLSDEASICGHSLQRRSLSDCHTALGGIGGPADKAFQHSQPTAQTLMPPLSQDPEKLSPSGQKVLPSVFGYKLAQQQLKEMKKKGLKEATQLYHVSSSPVHDTAVETSPEHSSGLSHSGFTGSAFAVCPKHDENTFQVATPLSELPASAPRVTPDRLSPKVELVLGPPASTHPRAGNSRWHERTADWVEMVGRYAPVGLREDTAGGGGGNTCKNPNFRRTSSFNDTRPQLTSTTPSRNFRERSMTQVGFRTLPEGSCWNRRGWERQPHHPYPIPEHEVSEWTKGRAGRSDQRKLQNDTSTSHTERKSTGTNTKPFPAAEQSVQVDFCSTAERNKKVEPAGSNSSNRYLVSGIGGPGSNPTGIQGNSHLSVDQVERAEQNWSRRGPSPIQRNILARKLKEAQSTSGVKGRQRSASFNASSPEHKQSRCHSLQMSEDCSSNCGSPYRLSEAEQKMLDLDLSTVYVQGEQ